MVLSAESSRSPTIPLDLFTSTLKATIHGIATPRPIIVAFMAVAIPAESIAAFC